MYFYTSVLCFEIYVTLFRIKVTIEAIVYSSDTSQERDHYADYERNVTLKNSIYLRKTWKFHFIFVKYEHSLSISLNWCRCISPLYLLKEKGKVIHFYKLNTLWVWMSCSRKRKWHWNPSFLFYPCATAVIFVERVNETEYLLKMHGLMYV